MGEELGAPGPGLRERKKRETRRRISDIATGLFLQRGFDEVTIADVARAADVSVNTVFNYFRTKEDLFFDRQDEAVEAPARDFQARRPGESAAAVFRRRFFEDLDARGHLTGLAEGSDAWDRTVRASPALRARQREIGRRAKDRLAARIAEDTGAGPDDIAPHAAAAMIFAVRTTLVEQIADRRAAGETPAEMRDDVYAAAARAFDLLEHGLGGYAAAPPDPTGPDPTGPDPTGPDPAGPDPTGDTPGTGGESGGGDAGGKPPAGK